jgi:GT2 family glycosyltransferase
VASRQVFGVNFAAAILTRSFLEAQPFSDFLDEDIWMYLDDIDFAARVNVMGWKSWLVPGAQAYHMGSASSSKNPGFSVFMSYRNNFYTLVKNFPLIIVLGVLPGALITDIRTLLQLVRHRNYSVAKAIVRARLVSLTHFGVFLTKKRTLAKYRKLSTRDLWKAMTAS